MFRKVSLLLGCVRLRNVTKSSVRLPKETLRNPTKPYETLRNVNNTQHHATFKSAFTLIELLASMAMLVGFLGAGFLAFNRGQVLSDANQQQVMLTQLAKAKFEELRAMDFKGLKAWYDAYTDGNGNGTPDPGEHNNRTFALSNAMGRIVLTDVYDDEIEVQPYLGAHDDKAVAGDNWVRATPGVFPARDDFAATVYNNKIWVFGGGQSNSVTYNDVWWSSDGVNWTLALADDQLIAVNQPGATRWSHRADHTALTYDGKMWIFGGTASHNPFGSVYNDVWWSRDGVIWTRAKLNDGNYWSPREDHQSIVFNNKMWVIGGRYANNANGDFNDVWYSTDGATWVQAKPNDSNYWRRRDDHCAISFDNKMWVMGGSSWGDGSSPYNDVWWSTDGAVWTQASPVGSMWSDRSNFSVVSHDGRMWVLGGDGGNGTVWHTTDGMNWTVARSNNSGTWATSAGANPSRWNQESVAFMGKIWILAGSTSSKQQDVWWSYGAERMYQVDISVSFRQREGRIIGEDNGGTNGMTSAEALNGILDTAVGEDANGNGILDSPVYIKGLLTSRGYPAQIYMGQE